MPKQLLFHISRMNIIYISQLMSMDDLFIPTLWCPLSPVRCFQNSVTPFAFQHAYRRILWSYTFSLSCSFIEADPFAWSRSNPLSLSNGLCQSVRVIEFLLCEHHHLNKKKKYDLKETSIMTWHSYWKLHLFDITSAKKKKKTWIKLHLWNYFIFEIDILFTNMDYAKPQHGYVITCLAKCGIKLLYDRCNYSPVLGLQLVHLIKRHARYPGCVEKNLNAHTQKSCE